MSAHEATDALMARLSYAASLRIRRQKTHHKTAKTALLFCLLWFVANYFFQLALEMDEAAMITLVSSTSSFFIICLAAVFPSATGDKLTITKVIAVALNIGGVVAITMNDLHDTKMTRGVLLALFSAFFYAAYLVFVKRKSDTEEKVDIPLFFGELSHLILGLIRCLSFVSFRICGAVESVASVADILHSALHQDRNLRAAQPGSVCSAFPERPNWHCAG